ncbi:MAG TPA: hypothetical protein VFQ61_31140 [Polyangiaceae bacterium]|nr:hypothetical protein [Polyangiaceae bacterium]
MTPKQNRKPGLAKTRTEPLVAERSISLIKSSDYRIRELFERADVISEGKTRLEAETAIYYGFSSILLKITSRGGLIPDVEAARVRALLARDPHARLRAVRIARVEAQVRAGSPIGRMKAELLVRLGEDGVLIDIDVEARVLEPRVRRRSRG